MIKNIFIDIDNTIVATNYLIQKKYLDRMPKGFNVKEPVKYIEFDNKKDEEWYINDILNNEVWNYVNQNIVDEILVCDCNLFILTSRISVQEDRLQFLFKNRILDFYTGYSGDQKIKVISNFKHARIYDDDPYLIGKVPIKVVLQPWNVLSIFNEACDFITPEWILKS